MYGYPYLYANGYYPSFFSTMLPVLALIIIVAGGLALYFLFVRKPNTHQGAAHKLHNALTFRTLYTEKLLRAVYCVAVVALAVWSLIALFSNFFGAILLFVIGNVALRIGFELTLLLLVLCRNTQEINQKMGPLPEAPVSETPVQPPVAPQSAPQAAPVPPQPETPHHNDVTML